MPAHTAGTRAAAEDAEALLAERHAGDAEPESVVTAEEWLAAQRAAIVVLARTLQAYLRWRNAHARHPDVLAAQRRERARIRSERQLESRQFRGHFHYAAFGAQLSNWRS